MSETGLPEAAFPVSSTVPSAVRSSTVPRGGRPWPEAVLVTVASTTEARPRVAQIDPRSAFVAYDDTVNHAPLLGVTVLLFGGRL